MKRSQWICLALSFCTLIGCKQDEAAKDEGPVACTMIGMPAYQPWSYDIHFVDMKPLLLRNDFLRITTKTQYGTSVASECCTMISCKKGDGYISLATNRLTDMVSVYPNSQVMDSDPLITVERTRDCVKYKTIVEDAKVDLLVEEYTVEAGPCSQQAYTRKYGHGEIELSWKASKNSN